MGFINRILNKDNTAYYQNINDANSNIPNQTFKERKSLAERKADVEASRLRFPGKVPVIIERYKNEKHLPTIEKVKFVVPRELTMAQLSTIVRNRMSLNSRDTFFLFTSTGSMPALSMCVPVLYEQSKDEDGFLYLTYASQEVFG